VVPPEPPRMLAPILQVTDPYYWPADVVRESVPPPANFRYSMPVSTSPPSVSSDTQTHTFKHTYTDAKQTRISLENDTYTCDLLLSLQQENGAMMGRNLPPTPTA